MKKSPKYLLTIVILLLTVSVVIAQGPEPRMVANECDHPVIQVDSATAGPIGANDQLLEAYASHCSQTNELVITGGTPWGGNNGHTGHVRLTYWVNSIEGQTIFSDTEEAFGIPEEDGAIVVPIRWEMPLDGKQYRIEVSAILCDITAGQCQNEQEFAWFLTTNTGSVTVRKYGSPVEGMLFHAKIDDVVVESYTTSQSDLLMIGGELVAEFVFDGLVIQPGQDSEVVVIEEDLTGQPYGVQVVSPQDGQHEVVISANAQNHTVEFVNRDNRIWIPAVQKPYPPGTCTREIQLQYVWKGEQQNRIYSFTPVSASIQDLGVLAYGTLVHMNMVDGQTVEEITLVKHFPDNTWDYVYTNWTGPYEAIYGAHDPLYSGDNIHLLAAGRLWGIEWNYLNPDGIRCVFAAQMVWDPPETSVLVAVEAEGEWEFFLANTTDPSTLDLPEFDRVMILSTLEEGWVYITEDELRSRGLID